jgi:DNA-directed RNA polymerase specialized sigma24 family protein
LVRSATQPPTNGVDFLAQYRISGSPAVFEQIMRAYGGMVFSVCVKVTKDPADAEDASQAVFPHARGAVQDRRDDPLPRSLAQESGKAHVPRSRPQSQAPHPPRAGDGRQSAEHDTTHPSAQSEQGEFYRPSSATTRSAPFQVSTAARVAYFGGLSHDEISTEMKCTPAALGVRLHRASKMLGKRLSDRGVSLAGTSLSAAIVASVGACISERFIRQTSSAMVAMGSGVAAPMMRMGLPAGLGQRAAAHGRGGAVDGASPHQVGDGVSSHR